MVSALKRAGGRKRLAVARDHHERAAVDVHGVNEAAVRADEANLERFADLHLDHVGRREGAPVDGEIVRLATVHRHRRVRQTFSYQPLLQLNRVFVIGGDLVRGTGRIDDQRAIQPQCLLTVDVVVRVVEIRAGLLCGEFVAIDLAVPYRLLGDVRRAVHHVRQDQSVPVDRRRVRQSVGDVDADPVALPEAQRRPGHLSVERVGVD